MRRSTTTHKWCYPHFLREVTWSDFSSEWLLSGRFEMTCNLVSQGLPAGAQGSQFLQIRPSCRTRWTLSATDEAWRGEDQNSGNQSIFDGTHWSKYSQNSSTGTFDPPLIDRADKSGPRASRSRPSAETSDFRLGVDTIVVQWCHRHPVKDVLLPCSHEDPHFFTVFIEFFAAAPMWFRSIGAMWQYPRVHPFRMMGKTRNSINSQMLMRGPYGTSENTNQKFSSCDHVTSTLTWTADRVNYTHSWHTSSELPPRRRTLIGEGTFATIPALGPRAPVLPTIMPSAKR